jgi:spore coat polysaccharide biosynthesis predicted glycosyltransferase SpsG
MAKVLLHAEGDARTGLGHLVRMVGVAGELAASHDVVIASSSAHLEAVVRELAPWARGTLETHGLTPSEEIPWARGAELAVEISRFAESIAPSMLVSDGKAAFAGNAFASIRGRCPIVLVDNVVAAPDAYDVLVLPTCHADPAIVARVGEARVRHGAAWTFLHPAVKELARAPRPDRLGVFVSMGGADPNGLTERAVRHLLASQPEHIVAAVGPANRHRAALEALANAEPRVRLVHGSPATQKALASARWALCAFGITAYEAVALGTPLVVVPHDGVVDRDIERFVAAFPDLARAVSVPESADGMRASGALSALQLGALAASLSASIPQGLPSTTP